MKRLLCICTDCYKLFTYVEHRTMKHLLCICIDCYLYVEHRFLIIVNFDMHCLYLILLKKIETYPRIGVFWESAVSAYPYRPRYRYAYPYPGNLAQKWGRHWIRCYTIDLILCYSIAAPPRASGQTKSTNSVATHLAVQNHSWPAPFPLPPPLRPPPLLPCPSGLLQSHF
jgi:hypothetical protein